MVQTIWIKWSIDEPFIHTVVRDRNYVILSFWSMLIEALILIFPVALFPFLFFFFLNLMSITPFFGGWILICVVAFSETVGLVLRAILTLTLWESALKNGLNSASELNVDPTKLGVSTLYSSWPGQRAPLLPKSGILSSALFGFGNWSGLIFDWEKRVEERNENGEKL